MSKPTLWLRCEKKEKLIDAGLIFVEQGKQRIVNDSEYEALLQILLLDVMDNNTWPTLPVGVPIIGLKALPESTDPIPYSHIQFSNCYKRQEMVPENGRRIAAFDYHTGFAGAATRVLAVASQRRGEKLGHLVFFENEDAMINAVKTALGGSGKGVKVLIIGALGRCRPRTVDLDDILKWDMGETAKGGPFSENLDVDIFVNRISLNSKGPPLISVGKGLRLSTVVDVSCDTTNFFNSIPIYIINTTFFSPRVSVDVQLLYLDQLTFPGLKIRHCQWLSVDHLPSLLPREASAQFSSAVFPSLLQRPDRRMHKYGLKPRRFSTRILRQRRRG
ncbi:uncharacterized protein BT62DRAFT_1057720 [Guyanagaster necrorhizus]|uniref:Uncharacterized protein n=1 Tax=Guyanagaster necrorhizus TaxID=856835 RepID=A0A9P8ALC3_9AGAR|nr:uncharacterized protein BT62DRAFT_1057720 [Guyanagaster necrorhizus MCA 3950]KAG7439491.1 hypothetical protein BT62DRAFT_1057720 [Guyanagaster necrorhizus MCA 3950]